MIVQDLQQEILTRIDALTTKIGVTVEYLWPHLVRLEVVRGVGLLVGMILCSIPSLLLIMTALRAEDDRNNAVWHDTSTTKLTIGIVFGIGALIFGGVFLTSGLPSILAPEATAFQNLLGR